jgi:hypothetical protein
MAKAEAATVVVKVIRANELSAIEAAAWHEGMTHALTWLGLKQYADVMAKDNPHGREGK